MNDISQQRCYNHINREAAARCPGCSKFICRECITEHDDRVLCTSCLNKLHTTHASRKNRFNTLTHLAFSFFGLLLLWLCFYYFGQILLAIPTDFHEGTIWKSNIFTGL